MVWYFGKRLFHKELGSCCRGLRKLRSKNNLFKRSWKYEENHERRPPVTPPKSPVALQPNVKNLSTQSGFNFKKSRNTPSLSKPKPGQPISLLFSDTTTLFKLEAFHPPFALLLAGKNWELFTMGSRKFGLTVAYQKPNIFLYIRMYLGQWDVSLDRI